MGRPPPHDLEKPIEQLTQRELPDGLEKIRFGVTPYLGPELTLESYQPITNYLEKRLGQNFELVIADSYGGLIDMVVQNKIDIFLISPLSYVVAKRKAPSIHILGQESASGMVSYSSYVVVREDSRAETLKDLAGKQVAFVDQHSTSGFLFPYASFLKQKINPFKEIDICFAGSHIKAISQLVNRQVDAATVSSNMVNFAVAKEIPSLQLNRQGFRILQKAGRIPYDALAVQGGFSPSGRQKIQSAFAQLNTRTPRGRHALAKSANITGWIPASDEEYDNVRKVYDAVHQHLNKHPISVERKCDSSP